MYTSYRSRGVGDRHEDQRGRYTRDIATVQAMLGTHMTQLRYTVLVVCVDTYACMHVRGICEASHGVAAVGQYVARTISAPVLRIRVSWQHHYSES